MKSEYSQVQTIFVVLFYVAATCERLKIIFVTVKNGNSVLIFNMQAFLADLSINIFSQIEKACGNLILN